MVIDSSALIAILRREPEEQAFRTAIKLASIRSLSARGVSRSASSRSFWRVR
jgi:uncharacterized protein with PIN domain